ncbi:BMP family protein [Bosea sp. NPDC055332]
MTLTRRDMTAALAASVGLAALPRSARAAGGQLKVAMALPGSIADGGWSQSAFEVLAQARTELHAETAYSEKVHQPQQVEVLSDYARRGYNLVIGHGGEFQDAVDRVAGRFPQTSFLVTNGLRPSANVATADFHFSQPAYLLGFLAARMSKTGKVGIIAAQKFKFTNDSVAGFEAGFRAARSDGQVVTTWTGDWDDVAKGKEAAVNQLAQGVDIVWPTMDSATAGSLQAVREKGAMAFGLYYDAITKWPDIMLQSAILDVRGLLFAMLAKAKAEGIAGRNYKFDITMPQAVRLGSFGPKVPPGTVAEIAVLVERMKSGQLAVQPV